MHADFIETEALASVLHTGGYEQYTTCYCTDFEQELHNLGPVILQLILSTRVSRFWVSFEYKLLLCSILVISKTSLLQRVNTFNNVHFEITKVDTSETFIVVCIFIFCRLRIHTNIYGKTYINSS